MRRFLRPLVAVVLVLVPAAARAVTIDQVVSLAKAGVSEAVILALIDRDKTVMAIEPDQLVKLHRDGVSDKVILAMLKSGRDEADAQVRVDSALNAARLLATMSPAPDLVVVGHGPDVPNAAANMYLFGGAAEVVPVFVPYGAPYEAAPFRRRGMRRSAPRLGDVSGAVGIPPVRFPPVEIGPLLPQTPPALCIAQTATGPVPPMVGSPGFVTVCPDPLQPRRSR